MAPAHDFSIHLEAATEAELLALAERLKSAGVPSVPERWALAAVPAHEDGNVAVLLRRKAAH